MKNYKSIFAIIGAVVVVAAAVTAIVVYKDKIIECLNCVKEKMCCCKNKVLYDEYADFADV